MGGVFVGVFVGVLADVLVPESGRSLKGHKIEWNDIHANSEDPSLVAVPEMEARQAESITPPPLKTPLVVSIVPSKYPELPLGHAKSRLTLVFA
jgi:hypothetical protein